MTAGEISWERKLEEAKEYLGGLPSELVEDIGTVIGLHNNNEGTARSGCSDPFAIFSFLAFALAVANFLMDMNGNRRRRRSLDSCPAQDTLTENAVFSSYSLIRSALNSVGVEQECSKKFICEGGWETRKYGKVGLLVGEAGAELLGDWRREHIQNGIRGFSCSKLYRGCRDYPSHYRNPAVDISNGNPAIGRGKTGTSSKGNPVKEENGSVPVESLVRELMEKIDIESLFLNKNIMQ